MWSGGHQPQANPRTASQQRGDAVYQPFCKSPLASSCFAMELAVIGHCFESDLRAMRRLKVFQAFLLVVCAMFASEYKEVSGILCKGGYLKR